MGGRKLNFPAQYSFALILRDAFSGDEHVEDGVLLDVVHGLLVRDHGEVVAVALEDLVVNPEPGLDGRGVLADRGHVNALEKNGINNFLSYILIIYFYLFLTLSA